MFKFAIEVLGILCLGIIFGIVFFLFNTPKVQAFSYVRDPGDTTIYTDEFWDYEYAEINFAVTVDNYEEYVGFGDFSSVSVIGIAVYDDTQSPQWVIDTADCVSWEGASTTLFLDSTNLFVPETYDFVTVYGFGGTCGDFESIGSSQGLVLEEGTPAFEVVATGTPPEPSGEVQYTFDIGSSVMLGALLAFFIAYWIVGLSRKKNYDS